MSGVSHRNNPESPPSAADNHPSTMLRSTALTLAAIATSASAQSSSCVLPADDNGHPAVDLNSLHSLTQDYEVVSSSNSEYVYHFNVCGQTVFQDSTCPEGSSVCEVKNGAGLDVYGYLDTIALAWDTSDTTQLVMSMTGAVECPFNKVNPYTTKVHFMCAQEGGDTITLRSEAYYQCALEFDFHTEKACGGHESRYTCDNVNHMCVFNASGPYADHDDCSTHCHPAPPPPPSPPPADYKYSCFSNFTCESVAGGQFDDESACMASCKPFQRTYSCYDARCVPDTRGIYKGEEACLEACGGAPPLEDRWTCGAGYTCTEDDSGEFGSEGDCETGCSDPRALYHCDAAQGICVEASDGIADRATCDAACTPGAAANAFEKAVVRGRVVDLR